MCTYLDTNFESILAYEKEVNDGNTFKSLLVDQYFSGMPFEYGHRVYTELNNKSEFNTYLLEYEKYVYSMGYSFKAAQECVQYLISENPIKETYTALHVANALNVRLRDVIRTSKVAEEYESNEETRLATEYYIEIGKLDVIRNANNLTWEELYEKIVSYTPVLPNDEGIVYAMESAITDDTLVDYSSYLKSPFQYRANANETISPVKGSLQFEKILFNFDTFGMYNMPIGLVYNSDSSKVIYL